MESVQKNLLVRVQGIKATDYMLHVGEPTEDETLEVDHGFDNTTS